MQCYKTSVLPIIDYFFNLFFFEILQIEHLLNTPLVFSSAEKLLGIKMDYFLSKSINRERRKKTSSTFSTAISASLITNSLEKLYEKKISKRFITHLVVHLKLVYFISEYILVS